MVAERVKRDATLLKSPNRYFWRTWDKQEVDYVEEEGGKFTAVEVKWQKTKNRPPKTWKDTYPNSEWKSVNQKNYWDFVVV